MSVYTHVNQQQLERFLTQYSLGVLVNFSGIQAGIQNTNYAVTTTRGKFILTVYESLAPQVLLCYLDLLNQLCQNNFPAPKPQLSSTDQFYFSVNGKLAAFFSCLPGRSIDNPSIEQCGEIGEYLAKLHTSSEKYTFQVQNTKDLAACQSIFYKIRPYLKKDEVALLFSELTFQSLYTLPDLPRGIIHADLFRDNVLFCNGRVSGFVDFYNACEDYYIYDIAVACNDWCIECGRVNLQKLNAFVSGYQRVRRLNEDEMIHFIVFLRRSALRFWITRLDHQVNPKKGVLTLKKDPSIFKHILDYYRNLELGDLPIITSKNA